MRAEERREKILEVLREREKPMSATALAKLTRVSRQVIVGDIALLRAHGNDIIATSRGYMPAASPPAGRYIGKIACRHSVADTKKELSKIVEMGGEVLNVVVTHRLYGDMTGQLNISTQEDVDNFINGVKSSRERLLSELTDGVHLHTILCRDKTSFNGIREALAGLKILLPE